jgi:[ribosomal protein S5]-alanine N-acetyltransferase
MVNMIKILGNGIYLMPFETQHLNNPRYYSWLCDPEVVKYLGREELLAGVPFDEINAYIDNLWKSQYCHFFAVFHAETDIFIGTSKISFGTERDFKHKIADIGIMIGDRYFWGKGLATETLRAVSAFAFDTLSARKLSAGGFEANTSVIKAFMKIGFKIDGRLRKHLSIGHDYCDHVLMSCFEHELIRN